MGPVNSSPSGIEKLFFFLYAHSYYSNFFCVCVILDMGKCLKKKKMCVKVSSVERCDLSFRCVIQLNVLRWLVRLYWGTESCHRHTFSMHNKIRTVAQSRSCKWQHDIKTVMSCLSFFMISDGALKQNFCRTCSFSMLTRELVLTKLWARWWRGELTMSWMVLVSVFYQDDSYFSTDRMWMYIDWWEYLSVASILIAS